MKADRRSLASGGHQNQTDTMTDDSGGGERAGDRERERTIEGARPTAAHASPPPPATFHRDKVLIERGLLRMWRDRRRQMIANSRWGG